jgi:cell division protease FtsH
MVSTYGMSDILGPLAYDKQGGPRFLGGPNNPRRNVSDATALEIDREVRGLVDRAHERALSILRHNRDLLEDIAQRILQKEVIEGNELKELLDSSRVPEAAVAIA